MAVETRRPTPVSEVLKGLVSEYKRENKKGTLTPELVNRFWHILLETSIQARGLDIPVPTIECDRTTEDLKALKREKRIWVPETGLTYLQLGQIFPNTNNSAVERDGLISDGFEQDAKGVDVEASIDSPNINTREKALERLFKSKKRRGMRLSTYILASQASKVLIENFLDQDGTWSWLPGSSSGDYVLGARFDSNGRLYILWNLDPKDRKSYLGGRSEGVKKQKKK